MKVIWRYSIFAIIGALTAFVPMTFNIKIDDWRWWVIYIAWRDEKIRKEAIEGMR
jgi:hypothetical protein